MWLGFRLILIPITKKIFKLTLPYMASTLVGSNYPLEIKQFAFRMEIPGYNGQEKERVFPKKRNLLRFLNRLRIPMKAEMESYFNFSIKAGIKIQTKQVSAVW